MLLQVQLSNCKAYLQFFYCNFYIGLYMAIKCKPYSEITVESGTQLKTVYICSVYDKSDHCFSAQNGILVTFYHMWPTNDGKKWCTKNIFEIPPCALNMSF